ncbi:MAG: M16 family metallopeptidase [Isosphaeraceae bacterium]
MRYFQISIVSSITLLGCVLVRGDVPDSSSSESVFPYVVNETMLDNGLTVLSVPYDSPGIVAYFTIVRTGSRNEVEKGLSGFAHFFEHMMFRGTKAYSAEKYNDLLRSLGADFNAYTNEDWTCYHLTIPATALAAVVEVEADRFQNLQYDEPSFQKEARAVLGEYNKGASSPFQRLNETMQNTAYTTHTYKHTTIGFLADVKDMPNQYAYSKTFFDRWYRPENCTIIAAGDVKHDALVSLCKKYYGRWKRGSSHIEIPVEPAQNEPRTAHLTWPLPTLPVLYLAYHIPAADPNNPDTAALGALEQAVFGETSPLYDELVLKQQKVVAMEADAESKRDPGLFTILARVRQANDLDYVRARIEAALDDAVKKPVGPARLAAIKSHLRHEFAVSLRSAQDVAEAVGTAVAVTGRPESINTLYDAYDRLAPADLQRAAQRYFQPRNETVITLQTEIKK